MAPMLLRLLAWRWNSSSSILLQVVLLCCCTGPGLCKGIHPRGVERTSPRQRKLQDDGQGSVVNIVNKTLLANPTDVLPPRGFGVDGMGYAIFDVDLLFNETTNDSAVYYVDFVRNSTTPDMRTESCSVKMAEKRSFDSTEYSISHVAGPWPIKTNLSSPNSATIWGLAILDAQSIVVADEDNSLLRKVDVATGNDEEIASSRRPARIAKHPTQPNILFVSTAAGIFRVFLDLPRQGNISEIPIQFGSESEFDRPQVGPQAVSRDGSILYAADFGNHVVRRVNSVTGVTQTIAGMVSVKGNKDGLPFDARFSNPRTVAVTSDGCNLFVSELEYGLIRWLPLREPHGDVIEVKTIVAVTNFDKSGGIYCVCLSKDEKFLFAGTWGGQIIKFSLNTSALHQCSSSQGSSSPPSSPSPSPPSQSGVPSPIASSSSSSLQQVDNSSGNGVALTVGLAVGLTCLILGACACTVTYCVTMHRQRTPNYAELSRSGRRKQSVSVTGTQGSQSVSLSDGTGSRSRPNEPVAVHGIRVFTHSEIREAMENGQCLTGKGGGYGDVYRASLMVEGANMDVAMKVMRGEFDESKYKQFIAEVSTLSQVRHKNLCKLVGYCTDEASCILVYPFIEGGSLHDRLHNVKGPPRGVDGLQGARNPPEDVIMPLDWRERIAVAKQVATCLRYLHHELEPPIMHRDIKSHNVLVKGKGKHLQAYVIDFGLSRSGNDLLDGQTISSGLTVATVTCSGTPGYMAPEYMYGSYLTMMNDTFSFGVLLLELITGRKAVMRVDRRVQLFLYVWARQWLSLDNLTRQQLEEITDPVLAPSLTTEEWEMVSKLAKLAHRCTGDVAVDRPSMNEILHQINLLQ